MWIIRLSTKTIRPAFKRWKYLWRVNRSADLGTDTDIMKTS